MAVPILRPLTLGATTAVCPATQFLERLSGTRLTADEVMVSFYVTSLCTSIPQDEAIETVSEWLERHYDEMDESVKAGRLVWHPDTTNFFLASASLVFALFKEIRQMSLLQTVPSSSEAKGHRDMQVSPEILAVVEDIK
nr:unnamed protein product [Spirometra erinaceieuropaei]